MEHHSDLIFRLEEQSDCPLTTPCRRSKSPVQTLEGGERGGRHECPFLPPKRRVVMSGPQTKAYAPTRASEADRLANLENGTD